MRDLRFETVAKMYLDTYRGIFSKSTAEEVGRRMRRIAAVVRTIDLTAEDPRRWSPEDVLSVISGLRSKYEIGAGSLRHLISDINRLCLFRGNDSVQVARVRYPGAFPQHEGGHIGGLSVDDREKLLKYLGGLRDGELRRASPVIMALSTGGRCMEIANLRIRDVDPQFGTVTFRIVKGMGSYGGPRTVPILPDCMHLVESVLSLDCGQSEFVIHNLISGDVITTNSLRRMRQKVEASSGVRFEYRTLRRAYADSLRSLGLPVDAVSLFLGHCSSDTTELYYYRLTEAAALDMFRSSVQVTQQTSQSGYEGMVHPPGFDAEHLFHKFSGEFYGLC